MSDSWDYAASPEPAGRGPFPWPPAEDESILAAFGATWRGAVVDADATFRNLPPQGGIGGALLYYLAIGILVAGAGLFWEMSALLTPPGFEEQFRAAMGTPVVSPIAGFLLAPMFLMFALFLAAGVTHVLLLMVGGARNGFGTTIRVFCYAYSPMIFGVVPILGSLVGSIWMVVVAIIGLRAAHATEGWRTAVAVLVPFALLLTVGFGFVLLVVAAGTGLLTG